MKRYGSQIFIAVSIACSLALVTSDTSVGRFLRQPVFAETMRRHFGPAKTPTPLTDVQKDTIQKLVDRLGTQATQMENLELKFRLAKIDFDRTKDELNAYVKPLQVEGFILDLNAKTYVKKEAK